MACGCDGDGDGACLIVLLFYLVEPYSEREERREGGAQGGQEAGQDAASRRQESEAPQAQRRRGGREDPSGVPHLQVQTTPVEAGAHQGLPTHGGRVHSKSGASEAQGGAG